MKGGFAVAAVAALATGANAVSHRHAHGLFAKRGHEVCVPSCTTIYTTITGEATRMDHCANLEVGRALKN